MKKKNWIILFLIVVWIVLASWGGFQLKGNRIEEAFLDGCIGGLCCLSPVYLFFTGVKKGGFIRDFFSKKSKKDSTEDKEK